VGANTDTTVTIQGIPGCLDGTWPITNVTAAYVYFNLGSVESLRSITGSTWQTGNVIGIVGSSNFVNQANGSTFAISEVQLEFGLICTPFERKLYNQELNACQRYLYGISTNDYICGMEITTSSAVFPVPFKIPMRIAPTGIIATGTIANNRLVGSGSNAACTSIVFTSAGINSGNITAAIGSTILNGFNAALLYPNAGIIYFTGAQI
jgi:hypothetical protein